MISTTTLTTAIIGRYLFCKEQLPAGTEFAVLDLMDDLEAGAKAAREKDRAKAKKALLEVGGVRCAVLCCPVL